MIIATPAEIQRVSPGTVCVTLAPWGAYRETIYHLIFLEEAGRYRFAAMNGLLIDRREEGSDRVIEVNGQPYFVCECGAGWGTGASDTYGEILSLQEGGSGHLQYETAAIDCPADIAACVQTKLEKAKPLESGGAHFIFRGTCFNMNII